MTFTPETVIYLPIVIHFVKGNKLYVIIIIIVFSMTLCFSYASGYTMDVIASTAFGIDVDIQETTDHEFIYHAKKFFGIPVDDRAVTRMKSIFNILNFCKSQLLPPSHTPFSFCCTLVQPCYILLQSNISIIQYVWNKKNLFLALLPKFIRDFFGLFVDMSFAGLETTNYLEGLTHTVLDQSKAQIEVK